MTEKIVGDKGLYSIGEEAYRKYRQSPEGVKEGLQSVANRLNDEGWYVKEGYVLEAITLIDNLLERIKELEEKVQTNG